MPPLKLPRGPRLRPLHQFLQTAPKFVRSQSTQSSVNPQEVQHFNALASTWWDPHGSSRLLHLMNPLRHDFIRACHASQPDPLPPSRKLKYLDIGCGGGIFAESAARMLHTDHVTAIDPTPEVLAVAKAHARRDPMLDDKLTYKNLSIEGLPVPERDEDKVDVLSCFEVIEHIQQPSAFLENCEKFVRPGGWMVMSTIARHWVSYLTTKTVAEDIMGIVPRGTHEWSQYVNVEELRGWFLNREGWGSPRCMGVMYVPGLGWKEVPGSERVGNYFFAIRRYGP